jgi:ceramide glucosyltransferase
MPCKGDEHGLERNITAVLQQTYGNYYTVVVTDSVEDPAYQIAESTLRLHPESASYLYTSSATIPGSGKVAALLTVLLRERGEAEVYATVDSDALVPSRWLGDLVDGLNDKSVGATSGFRWYFPTRGGGFWSYVEAAWNSSGTNLLFNDQYSFPWGGAMAVRAETLDKIGISEVLSGAISDDLALNSALRKHGFRILFLPQCIVATFNQSNRQRFLDWATRQTALTRAFNRGLWKYAAAAYTFFDFVLLLAVLSVAFGIMFRPLWLVPSALLLAPTAFGMLRSVQRNSTFSRALPEFKTEFERTRLKEAIASLIVPWIMTYCIIRSARTRQIEWRGRTYKLTDMKQLVASPRSLP